MPIFGEFETFGEPQVTASAKDYFSTVWKVRKIGEPGERVYILKVISPRRRRNRDEATEAQLEADRGLEFVGVIKQVKQALADGGRCLAPIHDFGTAVEGVWYVTDYCERVSLKALVNRQGQVDDAALRQVVYSIVAGCTSLARTSGRSHGNLKLSNVLRGGQNQPLRKTPLLLVDPMPVPSKQISTLDSGDRRSVEQTVHNIFEVQDLKAIGEIILQLVEGRVIESGYDYNYPIAASEAWARLGKSGESWRTLCNQLLDPQLSIDQVNFVWLAGQVKPRASGRYLAMAGGLVVVVGLAGGGIYAMHAKSEGEFKRHLEAATQASQSGDAVTAAQEIELALQQHPDNAPARAKRKDIQDQLQQAISANFAAGQLAEKSQQWNDAKSGLEKARLMAGKADHPQPSLAELQTERDYVESMDAGVKALADKHWDAAAGAAQKALGSKPADAAAQGLLTQAQEMKSAAEREQSASATQKLDQDFQAALTEAQKAFKDGNSSLALQKANVALGLKPDDAEARQLAATAKAQMDAQLSKLQQDQAYKAAVAEGRKALQGANYDLALEKANAALVFQPEGAEAKQLVAEVKAQQSVLAAKLQQQQAYEAALADGRNALQAGNVAVAQQKAATALRIRPDGAEARQLSADVKAQQAALAAKLQQEQAYQAALADGRKAFKDGNFTLAQEKAAAALGIKPEGAEASQLAADAKAQLAALTAKQQQQQAYQTALADGHKAFKDGNFALAQEKAALALGINPESTEARQLAADAKAQQAALAAKQQQDQAYQAALADGRKAFQEGNFSQALVQAEAALGIKRDGTEAKQLAADARAQQARQQQEQAKAQQEQAYQAALADGTKALQESNYSLAMEKANAALGIKPGDAAATALLTQATQANAVEAVRTQFAGAVAKAKSLEIDDPQQALAAVAEAKDLQAKNPDTIKPEPSLDALEKEIAAVRGLDQQLEDLLKHYGVQPKDPVHAVNPKNSQVKEYSASEKSDNYLADITNLKNLKGQYKSEWLNRERSAAFSQLETKLNLF